MVSRIIRGTAWASLPKCTACGAEFERKGSKNFFCSRACLVEARKVRRNAQYAAQNPKPDRACLHCGNALSQVMRSDAAYCSETCNQAAHNATKKASWKVGSRQERVSRAFIVERDGSRCHICGDACEPHEIHLDHVLPLARGGSHHVENLRVAHARCNLSKGARLKARET